jgi:hypothetical protein
VQTSQERLYQACQLIEQIAACILDYGSSGCVFDYFDASEMVGRLDLAVEVIRQENGASG